MKKNVFGRRRAINYALFAGGAITASTQFRFISTSFGFEETFSGFDGQTINWGGITSLYSDGAIELPNVSKALKKVEPGSAVPVLDDVLQKAIASVDPSVWEQKGFRLSIGEGGKGGTARFGMIMGVAAELTIQDSRTEINSFTVLRLIAYNFIFKADKLGARVIACYPVGGRVYNAQDGLDKTPISKYYLNMFTTKSAAGDTIADWYSTKLKNYPFEEIKIGLDYRVTTVKLGDKAKKGLMRLGIVENTFIDWVGFATTMSFGEKLKVSMVPFKNRTGDLQTFFRDGTAFNLQLPKGDIQITPKIHMWKIEYKDHPRDPNQFAQKISVFVQIRIQSVDFNDEKKIIFNQLLYGVEVQAVFKNEEYRRSDSATIFLLIEKICDETFHATIDPKKRTQLLKGLEQKFTTTERNREIKPYIKIKVHKQTAAKFAQECENVLQPF